MDIEKDEETFNCKVEEDVPPVEKEEKFDEANANFVDAEDSLSQMGVVLEPYAGMEFDSKDDAKIFYNGYVRRIEFVVRIMQRRRSETDGRTLARRLGCNKQGFSPSVKGKNGSEKKPRLIAREGCNASILLKKEKSGKWVVTRFVREHNHLLVSTTHECSMVRDKVKKIQELTEELQRQDQLFVEYRESLLNLLENTDKESDHLSFVESVRKAEAEALTKSIPKTLKV